MARPRLVDIDLAKGLGIALVVLGHIVAREAPADNRWYEVLKYVIYKFHMPFFMFVSGVVAAYTYKKIENFPEYLSYLEKRARRLLYAYFLFSLIVFFAKISAQQFLHVDNRVEGIGQLLDVLWRPTESFSSYLWFVWALFALYAIAPALLNLFGERLKPLLVVAFLVQFLPKVAYLGLGQVTEYAFVFFCGFVVVRCKSEYDAALSRFGFFGLIVFLGFLLGLVVGFDLPKWLVGIASIPALHFLARQSWVNRHGKVLLWLSVYAFPIYLMNTMAIGLVKGVVLKFTTWHGSNFYWIAPLLFFGGLLIPIFVKRVFFSKVPWLDRITA